MPTLVSPEQQEDVKLEEENEKTLEELVNGTKEPVKKTTKKRDKSDKASIKCQETRTLNIDVEGNNAQFEVSFCLFKNEDTPVLDNEECENSIVVPCLTTSSIRRVLGLNDSDSSKSLSYVYMTTVGGKRYVVPFKMIKEILKAYKFKSYIKNLDDEDLRERYKTIYEELDKISSKTTDELKELTTLEKPKRRKKPQDDKEKKKSPEPETSRPNKKKKNEENGGCENDDVEEFIKYARRIKKTLKETEQKHLSSIISNLI